MLKNYLKTAFRSLLRGKGFSIINISGLAVGMASAMLILLWIQNEVSYDRFYKNTDRLYTLYNRDNFSGKLWAWNNTPKIMGPTIKHDFSGVEDVVRFSNVYFLSTVGDKHFNNQGAFADSGYLNVFDFPLLEGDRGHALSAPYNIVLTEKFARALFGTADPMGKVVTIDSNANFTVTGVMKDLPPNTSFRFDYILPWAFMTHLGWDDSSWGNNSIYTYVLLKPNVTQASFDARVKNITKSHSTETAEVFTQPMRRMHLYSKPENGKLVGDRVNTVRLFAVIAAFILLIACINFMNLSTARSEKRAREVGIRKVVGALRAGLIGQFIGESILISIISFAMALGLVLLTLHPFGNLVGKDLSLDFANPTYWLFAIAFILFTGLLAGSYPAFYLSSFRPVKVLKGTFTKANALITPRKVLVIVQFTFAITLIICTLIIHSQIRYAQDRDAGYDRSNLIYTFTQGDIAKHYDAIKHELLDGGSAIAVNKTAGPITQHWSDGWGYRWDGSNKEDEKTDFIQFQTDMDFTKTTGVKLLEGRDIDVSKYATDSNALVLNEAAVKVMRLKHPVGATVSREGEGPWHVVGVVKDFILESPFAKEISPMFIAGPSRWFQVIHIKLNPANATASNLAKVEKIFRAYNPRYPFSYVFVDDAYADKFRGEQQIAKLAALFAGLTIFISCLGLFALATYMAENRVREIGIRKVLGASVTGITALLARDFVKLVGIAFIIATPLAWYSMHKWLENFGYHITIGWGVFLFSGFLALLIALISVGYQSARAAVANPIKSLRSE
jgi:ABC-type antimicrobial peptide transport system permease subunit